MMPTSSAVERNGSGLVVEELEEPEFDVDVDVVEVDVVRLVWYAPLDVVDPVPIEGEALG